MKAIINKLLPVFIWVLVLYLTTEWIMRGIYYAVFRSYKYITFTTPLVHMTKYFAIAILLITLFKRHATLAPAGKKLIPIFLVLSIIGLFVTALWFNGVSEEKIVKFRVVMPITKSWDDIDSVSTKIYHETIVRTPGENSTIPPKLIKKYNLHFKDGSVINVWDQLDSVYQLHQLVLAKRIDVNYLTEPRTFDQNFSYYFQARLKEAHFIFGVEAGN